MEKDNVALTPPMGWNSWDCYGPAVNEEQLLGNAQYMAGHLKEYGWEYVCCDIQWSEPTAGKVSPYYVPFAWLTLDEYGRQLPAVERFPSAAGGKGFGPIAEKIHNMGLKFGIHIMRGVPRLAVHQHLPVKGADTTCDKIASDASICRWNTDMYGIDASKEGAQAYYDSIFELYASWGVDYVKVDDICNTNAYPNNPYSAEKEIEMIRRAIDKCGRPMVLSLSPGPAVIDKAWHLRQNANMWRITDDFWDQWELLLEIPYGTVTTYGALARTLRGQGISAAAQAVGGAVGHNPISILIPCHRVVGSDGSLTGYAGGVANKQFLLELEGVDMTGLYVPTRGTAL